MGFIIGILFFATMYLYAEEKEIGFPQDKAYEDYEFQELQKTYILNRTIELNVLKKIPLNQYPEEFLITLKEQIKRETKEEMKKEMLAYLEAYLKNKNRDNQLDIKKTDDFKKSEGKKENTTIIKLPPYEELKDKQQKETTAKQEVKKETKKETKEEKKETKQEENLIGPNNANVKFYINSNHPLISITILSQIPIHVDLETGENIGFVDIEIKIRNVENQAVFLLKRFPYTPVNKTKSFQFLWERPGVPFGKYKPYAEIKFYDKKGKLIAHRTYLWGNTDSDKMYIIQKM